MSRRVDILEEDTIFQEHIFTIKRARLRHEKFDGTMSEEIVRMSFERGDSVAAVLHNVHDDTVLFTEQFRYPTVADGTGWMLELPAGVVEAGEDPYDTIKRELIEEIGYEVGSLRPIGQFYVSPGGTSERIFLYYATVTQAEQTSEGGGVLHEGENIRRVAIKVSEALLKITTGEICDAKTIIGLQWVQINRR